MIEQNRSLKPYNSLQLEARAAHFAEVGSDQALAEALEFARERGLPILPLGGGSNTVLANDFPGLVIRLNLRGVKVQEQKDHVLVWARAGENWHGFVRQMIAAGLHGLENLALIPGDVGAAPIQNIGAYGVEAGDCIEAVRAVETATGESYEFSRADCQFAYRESAFKQALKDRFIITDVCFSLSRRFEPNLEYGPLQTLKARPDLDAAELAGFIEALRQSKLPDPKELGNAGCFFKNPLVSQTQYQSLKRDFPELVAFEAGEQMKLAAGWLIDQAGLKGYRRGPVGVYAKQALVLVNFGGACGAELIDLACWVREQVYIRYGVTLEFEPRVYPED